MLKRVEEQFVEYFMDKIGPSRKTEKNREKVFSTLTKILDSKYENYGKVVICKYGSDPLKTYLPNSDIDITLIPVLQQVVAATSTSSLDH